MDRSHLAGSNPEILSWIIAGIGDIATKRVIPAILAEPRSHLYGAVSRDAAKGSRYATRVWRTIEEALSDPAWHAAYIATPVALHAPMTLAALRAGRHVLCEKPMAMNYSEAVEMADAAAQSGKLLGIAYYRRNYPKIQRAKALLAEGRIGKPVLAEISCHDWFDAENGGRAWLVDPAMAGGGPLYDIGSHRIDVLNDLFGRPVRVTAQLSNVVHQRAVEDSATLLIEYQCGLRGVVDVRRHCRQGRDDFRITGADGFINLSPLSGPTLACNNAIEEWPAHPNLHYPCVETFVHAVLDGTPLLSSGDSSLWTDWVTEQAMRARR